MIGSMASWKVLPMAPQYIVSKHTVFGLMRALDSIVAEDNIRIAVTRHVDPRAPHKVIACWIADDPHLAYRRRLLPCGDRPDVTTSSYPWVLPR
ncbi:hypothetical protein BGW80DRAFT_1334337 [Lactifluus volemus]|nr:hypothetical protein BGW80DRAFT_1334337 [Lactifluus volemus]